MKELLQRLLGYYQINYDEYLALSKTYTLDNFDDGHHFDQIEEASELVKEYIKLGHLIAIYGDYDADGIMGTSILTKMFSYLNYEAYYYIPNRYQDGYGLTLKKAVEYVENDVKLVITVDNGITAFEPIKYLKEHDVKVIVLDHHTSEERLPEADFIIHPILSHFGDIATSGAFTAFMFASTLLNRRDKYLSTLAAISLISDMMPLKGYNRNFLKTVISNYQVGEFLPIDLLANKKEFDWDTIGMIIAPRINSVGRLKMDTSINEIIPYFVSEDKNYILYYHMLIEELNSDRKNMSSSLSDNIEVDDSNKMIIVKGEYNEGLVGLIATSLVSKYHKPVLVLTKTKDDILKGSARSIEGFNIIEAFNALDKYFITRGGHALAAGCSIKSSDYEEFKEALISYANEKEFVIKAPKAIEFSINDINKDNLTLIKEFAPFGQEWPQPVFSLKHLKVSQLTYSKNQLHIIKYVGLNKKIVGWGLSKVFMDQYNFVDTYGTLTSSSFKGNETIDYSINKVFEAEN